MRTLKTIVVLAIFVGVTVTLSVSAQSLSVPDHGGLVTSAANFSTTNRIIVQPKDLVSGIDVFVTPVTTTSFHSPSWPANVAPRLISDAINKSLNNTVIVSPADYAVCLGRVSWYNFVYSDSTPLWQSTLNPWSPFENELGTTVGAVIELRARPGTDSVSLAQASVTFASIDGVLNGSANFVGASYTPLAPAIKADGTLINSGSTSQLANRAFVIVYGPLFSNGSTQYGLNYTRDYINSQVRIRGSYDFTISAQVGGVTSSATVSTRGYFLPPPTIALTKGDGVDIVSIVDNAVPGYAYVLSATSDLSSGVWQDLATFSGSNPQATVTAAASGGSRFYRVRVQ